MTDLNRKQDQRNAALQSRQALSTQQRQIHSRTILSNLLLHLQNQKSQSEYLLSYHALPSEVNVNELFYQQGFQIFAPVTHHHQHMEWHKISTATQWQTGCFGIMEPDEGDLWPADNGSTTLICPLAAFDRKGNRLGMGQGCFDFWLAQYRRNIKQVIGLAFSCQEVASIAVEAHDMPMDYIFTEQELIACRNC